MQKLDCTMSLYYSYVTECFLPLSCRFSIPEADMQELDGLEEHLVTGWNPIEQDPV